MSDILGTTLVPDPGVAAAWAASRKGTPLFCDLAALFWRYAPERGVRPEVAYAQAAKETAFGRYGGVVTPDFKNTCGLKVTNASGDRPEDHQRFPTWDVGIIAHLDHLALYAGAISYPRVDSPDPRHFTSIIGKAPTVEALGGAWAPALDYGTSLVTNYLQPLVGFKFTPPAQPVYATRDEVISLVGTIADALERGDAALTELAAVVDAYKLADGDRHAALSDALRLHQDAEQVRFDAVHDRLLDLESIPVALRNLLTAITGKVA